MMDLITCAFICLFLCVKALNIVPYASYSLVLDYETNKRHRGAFTLSTSSELDEAVNAIYCSRLCEQTYDCLGINVCMESGVTSCNLVPYSMKPLNVGKLRNRKGCSFFHKGPCLNGGIQTENRTCSCAMGYAGDFCEHYPGDCVEAYQQGHRIARAIYIQPDSTRLPFKVKCVLRRQPEFLILARHVNYTGRFSGKLWDDYRNGFGTSGSRQFFLGLDHIRSVLINSPYNHTAHVRVFFQNETVPFDGYYTNFSIDSAKHDYTLTYGTFIANTSTLEDGFSGSGYNDSINGQPFLTPDRDREQCARNSNSSWWFNIGCSYVIPTAPMEDLVWPRDSEMVPVDRLYLGLIANINP